MYAVGDTQWLMYPVGDGEERRISAMYAVGDTQWLMYPVGDGGGEEDLCHVPSGGGSVTHVPSGGWERKGGSLPCTQWGTSPVTYIAFVTHVSDADPLGNILVQRQTSLPWKSPADLRQLDENKQISIERRQIVSVVSFMRINRFKCVTLRK